MVDMKEIQEFARRLGEEFRPDRVILFGSYAYGEPTEDSDVDLLVVKEFEGSWIEESARMQMKLRPRFGVDLLVRTPKTIDNRLSLDDPFIKAIVRHGTVLYEATDP